MANTLNGRLTPTNNMRGALTNEGNLMGQLGGVGVGVTYASLPDKPSINGVTLVGNKTTSDLNINYNDLKNLPSIPDVGEIDERLDNLEGNMASLGGRVTTSEGNITTLQGDIGALDTRLTTSEGNIISLGGRVTTAEGNITSLDGRVTTNEGNITSLDGRVTTNEDNISDLQDDMTQAQGDITQLNSSLSDKQDKIKSLSFSGVTDSSGNIQIPTITVNSNFPLSIICNIGYCTNFVISGNTFYVKVLNNSVQPVTNSQGNFYVRYI